MKTIDRIILLLIALGLFANAFAPLIVDAGKFGSDVNIVAVGGKRISFGGPLPVK